MTARFLLDEHFSPQIADQLLARSIDAVAVSARPDLRTHSDSEVLEVATAEKRIVVTRNVGDFVRLDASWRSTGRQHSGIICVTRRRFPEDRTQIGAVTTALAEWAASGRDITGRHWFL